MKNLLFASFIAVIIAILLWPLGIEAAEFKTEPSGSVTISEKDSPKDLYTASGSVTVNANIAGDLVAAGGTVLVNGNVEDSLFVGGGTVTIRGTVGRHIRVSGGTVTISSKVTGDLLVAGGTVELTKDASIAGSLYATGGTIHVDGTVAGETKIAGGKVTLGGTLVGVTVEATELTLTDTAVVTGDLWHTGPNPATISSSAIVRGQTHYQARSTMQPFLQQFWSITLLLQLLGAMVFGWLIWRFWPKTTGQLVSYALQAPGAALWLGLGVLFLTPIAVVILMVSLIGLPLAFVFLLVWLTAIALGSLIGKIIFGAWLVRLVTKDKGIKIDVQVIVIGVLLLALLGFVPFVGPLITFIFFLLGFGSTVHFLRSLNDRQLAASK